MNDKSYFFDDQHSGSKRFAVLEDDGVSAWLYLTASTAAKPVSDVWVYNRIEAPMASEISSFRGGPPPAPQGFAGNKSQITTPRECTWSFRWTDDGESVALFADGQVIAYLRSSESRGYSINLLKPGPWGNTFDDEDYSRTFGAECD